MKVIVASLLSLLTVTAWSAEPDGSALYATHCAACHQADGSGAVGLAPSLVGTLKHYVNSEPGKQFLSQLLVSGMAGKVTHSGVTFMGFMPSLKDQLTDAEMAATMNYVLTRFNAQTDKCIVTTDAVAKARAAAPNSGTTYQLRSTIK